MKTTSKSISLLLTVSLALVGCAGLADDVDEEVTYDALEAGGCDPADFPEDGCSDPAAADLDPLPEEDTTEESLDESCETHLECATGERCENGECVDNAALAPAGTRCYYDAECASGSCLDLDGAICDEEGGLQCTCGGVAPPASPAGSEPAAGAGAAASGAEPAPAPAPAPAECEHAAPTFSVTPDRRIGGAPGKTVYYQITITSHDTGACDRTLDIAMDLPGPKWSYAPGQVTLAAGATKAVSLKVTASPDATPGTKALTLKIIGHYNGHTLYSKALEYVVN